MELQTIDYEAWPRRERYAFFGSVSNPFYMVTFRQEVTKLVEYTRKHSLSFYLSMTYLVTEAINAVEAFHYLAGDSDTEIHRLTARRPSFTDLHPGAEQFHIVTMPAEACRDLHSFCTLAAQRSAAQQCFLDMSEEGEDLIYISCIPWMDITGVTNERDLERPASRRSAIPCVTWGKYVADPVTGVTELGVSIEVNHRFIDGYHLGQFAKKLTALIEALPV